MGGVAQRLRALGKEGSAVIGQFGGDELILACDVKDGREVETIAAAVLAEVTRPIRIDEDGWKSAARSAPRSCPTTGRTSTR